MKEQIINKYIDTIYDIIANINDEQEEHFIEDLDYIKTHLECAINYKEILEEQKAIKRLEKENEALRQINKQLCKELNTSNMSEEEWLDYAINYNLEELERRIYEEFRK